VRRDGGGVLAYQGFQTHQTHLMRRGLGNTQNKKSRTKNLKIKKTTKKEKNTNQITKKKPKQREGGRKWISELGQGHRSNEGFRTKKKDNDEAMTGDGKSRLIIEPDKRDRSEERRGHSRECRETKFEPWPKYK